MNELWQEAVLRIHQMAGSPRQTLADHALEEAVRLTRSTIGYLAFMNEDESILTMHSWSRTAMRECGIPDRPLVYPVATCGLWGEAVRQRRPVITNDYEAPNPLKRGLPEGHVRILRHLNVPLFEGDRIVAVAGIGNKAEPYDDDDARRLALLVQAAWQVLRRGEAERELDQYRKDREARVRDRTVELVRANAELQEARDQARLLFEESPVAQWEEDGTRIRQALDDLRSQGIADLRSWLETRPDQVRSLAGSARTVAVNRAACELFGIRDPGEAAGVLHRVFPGSALPLLREGLCRMAEGGDRFQMDGELRTIDGDPRWVSLRFTVLPGHHESLKRILLSAEDLTRRRRVEADLAWQTRVQVAMADLSRGLLGASTRDEACSLVLGHARDLTGSPIGFVGYVDPATGHFVVPTLTRDAFPGECAMEGQRVVFTDRTGLWGWVLEQREPLLVNDVSADPRSGGTPPGHVPVRRFLGVPALVGDALQGLVALANPIPPFADRDLDVTRRLAVLLALSLARLEVEDRLKRTLEDLERSNQELEAFAYVASHDLQEPLRMVVSYLGLLERRYRGQLGPEADDFIGFAVEGGRRMQRLIEDLLAWSRVGTRARPFEPVDCNRVVSHVLGDLGDTLAEARAVVTVDPLPRVQADESQLEQLFQNLLGNALKFRGQDPPRVHVSAEMREGDWQFAVQDNGIGIGPEYHERIFRVFQRLHGRNAYEGTGIGLAICKKVVERHGGRIWVESEAGQGAKFCFTIPDRQGGR